MMSPGGFPRLLDVETAVAQYSPTLGMISANPKLTWDRQSIPQIF